MKRKKKPQNMKINDDMYTSIAKLRTFNITLSAHGYTEDTLRVELNFYQKWHNTMS